MIGDCDYCKYAIDGDTQTVVRLVDAFQHDQRYLAFHPECYSKAVVWRKEEEES